MQQHAHVRVPYMCTCICNGRSNENQHWCGFWGTRQLGSPNPLCVLLIHYAWLLKFGQDLLHFLPWRYQANRYRYCSSGRRRRRRTLLTGRTSLASNPLSIWQPTEALGCACWISFCLCWCLCWYTHIYFVIACVPFVRVRRSVACVCRCELL